MIVEESIIFPQLPALTCFLTANSPPGVYFPSLKSESTFLCALLFFLSQAFSHRACLQGLSAFLFALKAAGPHISVSFPLSIPMGSLLQVLLYDYSFHSTLARTLLVPNVPQPQLDGSLAEGSHRSLIGEANRCLSPPSHLISRALCGRNIQGRDMYSLLEISIFCSPG